MQFGQTSILILSLFWIIPLLILFYIYAFKKKATLINRFCSKSLKSFIMPNYSRGRQWFKAILITLSILFMIIALMRPRWGFHWEEMKRVGIDIIVAIDCSQSMMAEDVKPNRLERAKREIQDLLNMMDGDRIGLVAFAGTSFVQCPLTLDYGAFKIFLDYLDTELIPVQGTAITQAIKECNECFDRTQKGSKAIILITDGEDHEGDPLAAATEAKERGIRIFTIGIGQEGGAPIPEKDGSGFKKDREGNLILTKLDENTLQRMALETGGSYVRSVTGDLDLEEIYLKGIKKMEQRELASTKKRIWEERFQWFLFIALLFLIIEQLIPERKGLPIKKIFSGSFMTWFFLFPFMIITLLFILPLSLNAKFFPSSQAGEATKLYNAQKYDQALTQFLDAQIDSPEDPLLHYNIGNTYYKMGNYEEASKSYLSTARGAKDFELEEKSYYNLGNCSYRMGKLDEAITWYQKALELKPDDEDAKHNLEFVREEIKRRINEAKEQQDKQKQEGGKQEQQQEQQQQQQQKAQGAQEKQGEQQQAKEGAQGEKDKKEEGKEKEGNRAVAEGEEKKDAKEGSEKGKEGDKQQALKAKGTKELSQEEAEMLLKSLNEERKKEGQKHTGQGFGQMSPEKDW